MSQEEPGHNTPGPGEHPAPAAGPAEEPVQAASPGEKSAPGDYQAIADVLLARLAEGLAPEDAALALAVLLNRASTRLHNVSRGEAAARKQQPEWPAWAQLQNASRTLVLQASTCRDLAARLAGRRQ